MKEPLVLAHVTGIGGEYRLSCKVQEEKPKPLAMPREVSFYTIKEKHSDLEARCGKIVALAKTGAVLETDAILAEYDNLQIDAAGKLFAKVLSKEEEGWLLRFTAVPEGFQQWYLSCISSEERKN